MKTLKLFIMGFFAALLIFPAIGCEREGPLEKAGEKADEAMEETGEKAREAMEETGEKMEEAGEKVKDTLDR